MGITNQSFQHQIEKIKLNLKKVEKLIDKDKNKIVKHITEDLEKEIEKRVPVDSGALEESIRANYLINKGLAQATVYMSSNVPYSIYLHEGEYNLGKNSIRKQLSQPEKVGRKFFERAWVENKQKYQNYMIAELKRVLR